MCVFGVASTSASAAEITLKAVSAFPKTQLMTVDFIKFINALNKKGKGTIQIKYLGGPEVANPREAPIGLRRGLFDIIYGPPTYYSGLFPEADFFLGTKTPMERRANGFMKTLDGAFRKRLGAHAVAHFVGSIGLHLWLTKKPPLGPLGIDLSGFKVRTSPAYRDFVKALGGTAVVMRGTGAVYTALERGVVQGTGLPIVQVRDTKIHKFVKYRVDPAFFQTVMLVVVNAKKFDGMSQKARDLLTSMAIQYERDTFASAKAKTESETKALDKEGVKTIKLKAKPAAAYVDTFLKTPWARLEKNKKKIDIDIMKMRKLTR